MTVPQWLSLTFASIALIIQIIWAVQNRAYWLRSVPMMLWLAHAVIFYVAVLLFPPEQYVTNYSGWSSLLRLHGYMTVSSLALYRLINRRDIHG